MPPESSQWIIPAPVRTLLWWPLIALVVAIVRPTSAPMIITAAGVCLVLLGAVHAALKTLRLDDIDISATAAGPTSAPSPGDDAASGAGYIAG